MIAIIPCGISAIKNTSTIASNSADVRSDLVVPLKFVIFSSEEFVIIVVKLFFYLLNMSCICTKIILIQNVCNVCNIFQIKFIDCFDLSILKSHNLLFQIYAILFTIKALWLVFSVFKTLSLIVWSFFTQKISVLLSLIIK